MMVKIRMVNILVIMVMMDLLQTVLVTMLVNAGDNDGNDGDVMNSIGDYAYQCW